MLDRTRPRRTFRRLTGPMLSRLLGDASAGDSTPGDATGDDGKGDPPVALAGGSHEPPGPAGSDGDPSAG